MGHGRAVSWALCASLQGTSLSLAAEYVASRLQWTTLMNNLEHDFAWESEEYLAQAMALQAVRVSHSTSTLVAMWAPSGEPGTTLPLNGA